MTGSSETSAKYQLIFHIARRIEWDKAQRTAQYTGDTLSSEGFIHCSTEEQVVEVANRLFFGRKGLILLCIDSMLLNEELKYEPDERGTHYPHLYGQLNVDAVVGVMDFEPDEEGFFHLPEIVEELKANRTGTLLH